MPIEELIAAASAQSPIVKNYAVHVKRRTARMANDMLHLASMLETAYGWPYKSRDDISGETLKNKVLNYIEFEQGVINDFDVARKQPGAPALPFQVSSHKLVYILNKVHAKFAGDDGDNVAARISSGEVDQSEIFGTAFPMLRTDSFYGSNRATIEAATMFCVRFATSMDTMKDYAPTDCSIAHVTPCKDLPECFVKSNSRFSITVDGVPGLAVPHGGYAFGGQRTQPNQKEFGFEDCSSLLANILHQSSIPGAPYAPAAPVQPSTAHQLFAWREREKDPEAFIDRSKDMYDEPMEQYWDSMLEPHNPDRVNGKTIGLQPGDIYLLRTFAKAKGDPDLHATGGGHTGVVIGKDPHDPERVLIFECARDMESEDPKKGIWGVAGAGVGSFAIRYDEQTDDRIKRNMFLRPRVR